MELTTEFSALPVGETVITLDSPDLDVEISVISHFHLRCDAANLTLMALETTLAEITTRLRQGKFPNEQAISQGVVLRLLQELGWDTWDTALVWPEYQTGEGRADFALCCPPSKPAILVEVKQPGKAEDSVRHLSSFSPVQLKSKLAFDRTPAM